MKRAAAKRPRRQRLPEVDEGQIIEMLRLTPTERLLKGWRYAEWSKELQKKFGLKDEEVCLFSQIDHHLRKLGLTHTSPPR